MAVVSFIGGVLFWYSFRHLDAQEDELNQLATGHLNADDPVPAMYEKEKYAN